MLPITAVRFFGIGRGALRYVERVFGHNASLHLLARLRIWLYRRLVPLAPAILNQKKGGDLTQRLLGDIEILQNFIVYAVVPLVSFVAIPAAVALFLSFWPGGLSWWYLAYYLGVNALLLLATALFSAKEGRRAADAEGELRSYLHGALAGLREVLLYNARDRVAKALEQAQKRYHSFAGRLHLFEIVANNSLGFLAQLLLPIILVAAGPSVLRGDIEGRIVPVMVIVVLSSFEALAPLVSTGFYWGRMSRAWEHLFSLMDQRPAVEFVPEKQGEAPVEGEVRFEGVGFAYPEKGSTGDEENALFRSLDWRISKGEKIALLGPSGAGKTTLLNLLERFWDVSQGRIVLAGRDLRHWSEGDLRRQLGYIGPQNHIFADSVKNNLLMAKGEATEEDCWRALERAALDERIKEMPQGLDTLLGTGGVELSGGERKRLFVAQLVLQDAPIWLVDEPTEGLDYATEQELLARLRRVWQDKTVIWVTHRYAPVALVDRRYYLDGQGQLQEV
jgi:ATP-binding cassette subfamily C protein CydC